MHLLFHGPFLWVGWTIKFRKPLWFSNWLHAHFPCAEYGSLLLYKVIFSLLVPESKGAVAYFLTSTIWGAKREKIVGYNQYVIKFRKPLWFSNWLHAHFPCAEYGSLLLYKVIFSLLVPESKGAVAYFLTSTIPGLLTMKKLSGTTNIFFCFTHMQKVQGTVSRNFWV